MTNQKELYLNGVEELREFVKAPTALFKSEKLKKLSDGAKLLYIALLSRLSLSQKNNWRDDSGRLYVYYTLKNATDELGCCTEKAVKLFAELSTEKGVGLIERKRWGFGKPCMIYFTNINSLCCTCRKNKSATESVEKSAEDLSTFYPHNNSQCAHDSELHNNDNTNIYSSKNQNNTSELPNMRLRETSNNDFGKTEPNKNNINNIKKNNININNNQSIYPVDGKKETDSQKRNFYETLLKKNIGYDNFQSKIPVSRLDEFVAIMTDVLCTEDDCIKIGGKMLKAKDVKERFLKLEFEHLNYVYDSLQKVKTTVSNPRAYIISSLYNALDSAYLWGDIKDK